MIYSVLKNCNLSENGFSLSLTRGEKRSDLLDRFSKSFIQWHCDEKFLKALGGSEEEEITILTQDEANDLMGIADSLNQNPNDNDGGNDDNDDNDDENDDNDENDDDDENDTEGNDADNLDVEDGDDEADDIEDELPDFGAMSVSELKSYAKEYGIDINGLKKKDDIIDAIIDDLAEEE